MALPAPCLPTVFLTLHFEVHGLGVLADGVAGGADILPSVCVLDALQGQGRHAGMAAHHHVPVQGLPGGEGQRQARGWAGPGDRAITVCDQPHSPLLSGPMSESRFRYRLARRLRRALWELGCIPDRKWDSVYSSSLAYVPRLA